jgi:hypothetical protein
MFQQHAVKFAIPISFLKFLAVVLKISDANMGKLIAAFRNSSL